MMHEDEFEENVHFQFLSQGGVSLKIGPDGRLPHTWIPLDNQSTVDVFHNAELLRSIHIHTSKMDIHCLQQCIISTQLIGDLHGYGTVLWYNPKGIANILSLARVKEHGYRVTFDSSQGNEFHVHKPDGTCRVFKESMKGLYYMDTKDSSLVWSHTYQYGRR